MPGRGSGAPSVPAISAGQARPASPPKTCVQAISPRMKLGWSAPTVSVSEGLIFTPAPVIESSSQRPSVGRPWRRARKATTPRARATPTSTPYRRHKGCGPALTPTAPAAPMGTRSRPARRASPPSARSVAGKPGGRRGRRRRPARRPPVDERYDRAGRNRALIPGLCTVQLCRRRPGSRGGRWLLASTRTVCRRRRSPRAPPCLSFSRHRAAFGSRSASNAARAGFGARPYGRVGDRDGSGGSGDRDRRWGSCPLLGLEAGEDARSRPGRPGSGSPGSRGNVLPLERAGPGVATPDLHPRVVERFTARSSARPRSDTDLLRSSGRPPPVAERVLGV